MCGTSSSCWVPFLFSGTPSTRPLRRANGVSTLRGPGTPAWSRDGHAPARCLARRRREGCAVSVIQEKIDVEVPVRVAYNQWTQFEDFPQFMDGVEEVRQITDESLEW